MKTRSILLAATILTMSLATLLMGRLSASAQIYDWTTIAGTVMNSGSADGTNTAARFHWPAGIAAGTNDNLYVADESNYTIRKITLVDTNWVTTTIAGSAGNPHGSTDGTNSDARFYNPCGVTVDTNGNLYVADTYNRTIRKIVPVGTNWVTTTIAGLAGSYGHADGTNSDARFGLPFGIVLGTDGNLYVTDNAIETVRKITPVGTNWVTTTIAGLALNDGSADGTNTDARFNSPLAVTVDTNGNLYVADVDNHTIRKITPVGTTGTNWVTTTIAGLALNDGSADGTNGAARFYQPYGIAADGSGNLYVAEYGNSTIRKITPVGANWVVSTIGGLAENSGSTDGINSFARFNQPRAIAVDSCGNLYVADTENDTIRQGVPWGTLTVTKETAKLNFNPAKTNACSCALTATIDLDSSYNLTNKLVSLDIAGADVSFTLDAKGKGRGVGANGTCKLSYKKKTGPWTFTAKLKNGSWATQWGAYGLMNATTNSTVTLPVVLVIGDETFAGEKPLLYKAKAGKSGSAK